MTDIGTIEIIWRISGMEIYVGPFTCGMVTEFDVVAEQVFAMDKGWA